MQNIKATDTSVHFNDWPNEQGFDANHEQKTPIELSVTGSIPHYAAGTLYRTGPGRYKVDTKHGNTFQVSHWFDGFSQTHRFQLVPPESPDSSMRVFYNSRFSTDDMIDYAHETGSLGDRFSFGGSRPDPCEAIYSKVQSTYEPRHDSPSFINTGVTLSINMPGLNPPASSSVSSANEKLNTSGGVKTLTAKTDNSTYKQLHPSTLEPLALATQEILHSELTGPLSASHAKSDPETGDVYNYNLSFSSGTPTYRVFRVSAKTEETSILAAFTAAPAYLHSFFLTGDYVVVCVWNAHLTPEGFMKKPGSYIGAIKEFDDQIPARWYVVDRRHGRGLVAIYESQAFFCFHTINAWQETSNPSDSSTSQRDIVAECIMYENPDILHKLYYEYLVSSSSAGRLEPSAVNNGGKMQTRIARFRLPAIPASFRREGEEPEPLVPLKAILVSTACHALSPELATLNPSYITQPHRYAYAVTDRGLSTFVDGIVKFDSLTGETKIWSEHAQSPGEAIFVADPEGKEEDDGVLLSVVLDGRSGSSYLLVLDAGNMKEIGRASVNGAVGFGFHGVHVSGNGVGGVDF
ncbi:carotenoid oxygenase family protein [Aspergillus foveolatus]|uniref:carotenoid oxygenase family protein n=1 Tax=Aspergillus foveolatus TaxID=210207 RepID=UPI003CCD315D